ncbi:MAG: hypothetical protein JRJ84_05520 [Deltaproteobacteria bacterium]|nr:hypothetical protein [Deltaproteobacteria bacterium]
MGERVWQAVGVFAPTSLAETRIQMHHAAQLASAPGTSLLEDRGDFIHTSLQWVASRGVLAGQPLPWGVRAALRLVDLHLLLLDENGAEAGSLPLVGVTVADALQWLAGEIGRRRGSPVDLALPDHELPHRLPGRGAAFTLPSGLAAEDLSRWYDNADQVLRALREEVPNAGPLCAWPHHFDIATLVRLDPEMSPEGGRSIGVGLSPGDGSYDQPYFYATPWPYPREPRVPVLDGGGSWHREGWFGAVLLGSRLAVSPGAEQRTQVEAFLRSAFVACRGLLAA